MDHVNETRPGLRAALARRLGRFLGVADLFRAVAVLQEQQEQQAQRVQQVLRELQVQQEELGHDLRGVGSHLRQMAEEVADLCTLWDGSVRLELEDVPPDRCVSVVLATWNRPALLERAVRSVLNQSYSGWELVVVDDGSDDEALQSLADVDDPRVRTLRQPHLGLCSARNAGLAAVTGDFVTYLDDDNVMHPGWVRAVVWAFHQDPDVEVVLGGRLVDDWGRAFGLPSSGARLQMPTFDRARLAEQNIADIGMVAHRANLPEAHFDEELTAMEDWDLIYRLTRERDPFLAPAIACLYTSSAPNRMTDVGYGEHNLTRVREKIRRDR